MMFDMFVFIGFLKDVFEEFKVVVEKKVGVMVWMVVEGNGKKKWVCKIYYWVWLVVGSECIKVNGEFNGVVKKSIKVKWVSKLVVK